jgi:hypothetical protein
MADAESKADAEEGVPPDKDAIETLEDALAAVDLGELLDNGEVEILDYLHLLSIMFDKGVEYAEGALFPAPPVLADLCAAFDLEDKAYRRAAVIAFDTSQTRADVHAAAAAVAADLSKGGAPAPAPLPASASALDGVQADVTAAADAVVDAARAVGAAVAGAVADATAPLPVPKDAVHVSDTATVFKNWHRRGPPPLPYKSPWSETIEDASIVANIKKARSMLPVVPHGTKGVNKRQYAGTLAWTPYPPKKTAGWMYVEPRGEYMDWVWERIQKRYDEAKVTADDAEAKNHDWTCARRNANRLPERAIAASRVTILQEGLPSAINTYDGTLLTWGVGGFAAPGNALPRVFEAMLRDENCAKVMYLCGFWYDGTPNDPIYQVVDVDAATPRLLYGQNVTSQDFTDRNGHAYKAGDRNTIAWKVFEQFSNQLELIYMLIALARDPLTRETVFAINLQLMIGMCTVPGAEHICTEALYVFCAETQHEWNTHTRARMANAVTFDKILRPSSPVEWAIAHFTPEEKKQFIDPNDPLGGSQVCWRTIPCLERDKAIAKGVFRFVMRCCQEDAFPIAVARLKERCAKLKVTAGTLLSQQDAIDLSEVLPTYALHELMKNYWDPMRKGIGPSGVKPHQLGEVTLDIPDFPQKLTDAEADAAGPDDVLVRDPPGPGREPASAYPYRGWWKIGTQAQCEFLFTPNARLMGYDADGRIVMRDPKTKKEWKMEQDKQTRRWSRVDP